MERQGEKGNSTVSTGRWLQCALQLENVKVTYKDFYIWPAKLEQGNAGVLSFLGIHHRRAAVYQ